ncbi:glycosyltransferase family 2 protein [Chryseobacterium sp. SNU WT5]|uniref:glycosyltransferase family 2 protein n=1 Tax=Chryseobacterium sp. SNU WT5 TaxID=2594269 RepID=UPI00117CFF11|nr:glycosyltransferase family 2 protein [Chryseobacterium sp. SNU WT5]QDP84657.1 glycosyltransferase family 2 protein [Chryseobacterium sp. SNU WT5]
MGISVVINTYNAELHFEKVLQCVQDFDEILICDMGSDDRTIEIAHRYNCTILPHEKLNFVEPARNFAIQSAKNEWVLLLDADEIVSEDLKTFLYEYKDNVDGNVCLAIPRRNYFLGKFMRSAYPDYVYRFFRKDFISWPEFIHSKPEINGKTLKVNPKNLQFAIEHLANDSVSTILQKNNNYSTAEITKRLGNKVTISKLIFSPFFWFFKYYFIKKGFLDGKEGLIFAILKSQYKFATLAKLVEYKRK